MTLDLAGIFAAGLLTFVTPCVLPLIPVYLAVLMGGAVPGDEAGGVRQRLSLLFNTLMFVGGFMVVFVALGLTATSLGSLLTEYRNDLVLLGGLLILLFGLKFAGVLQIGWLERDARLDDRKFQTRFPWLNALVMGFVFALGWTPCVGPILGSVLTYTASTTADPLQGALYLTAYGLGFAVPLLVLSLFADAARSLVSRIAPRLPLIQKVTGVLLVIIGLYVMFDMSRPPPATVSPEAASGQVAAVQPPLGQPTERPRMVEFVSNTCSICRQMIPTVALIERDCGGRKVDVIKVDVSNPENRALAKDYRVRGVPTFVFLDKKGQEAARLVGHQTLQNLRQSLSVLVGGKCDGVGQMDNLFVEGDCTPGKTTGATCGS